MLTQIQKEKEKIINNIKHCKWHVIKVYGSVVAVKFLAYEFLKDFNLNNKGLKFVDWQPLAFRKLSGDFRFTFETISYFGHYGRPQNSQYLGSFEKILDIPSELFNKPQEQQKHINKTTFSNFIQF